MTPARKVPDDIFETPTPTPTRETATRESHEAERPSGSWPRNIEKRVEEIHGIVTEIDKTLRGTQARPFGLVHEVAALKSAESGRKRWMGLALLTALTAVVANIVNWITTGKTH